MVDPIVYWILGGFVLIIILRVQRAVNSTYRTPAKHDEDKESSQWSSKRDYTIDGRKIVIRKGKEYDDE